MSVEKWRQQGKAKAELEEQEEQIRQKFKINKINKGFSQLSGEELFKPITKRLDKAAKEPEPAEEPAGPNYEMDEFDRLNPFYGEFRPDAETPPPSPSAEEPAGPNYAIDEEEGGDEEEGDDDEEGGDEAQETTSRKAWEAPAATPFLEGTSESVLLQTVNRLIKQYDGDPNYRVKKKTSPLHDYSVKDLKRKRDEILRRRGELPQPAQSPPDDTSWEMETEGSGLGKTDAEKLINQLYVSLGSIRAGNTSTKLRKQVVALLKLLVKHELINEFQRKKIVNDYIAP